MNNSYQLDNNNSSNNNDDSNNSYFIKLYNLVFNNIYIRKIIFYHLNKFNILSVGVSFSSLEEIQKFRYKEYLNSIFLTHGLELDKLPENVRKVEILALRNIKGFENEVIVPDHIESIGFYGLKLIELQSPYLKSIISTSSESKFKNLVIRSINSLESFSLPESITDLKLSFIETNPEHEMTKILKNSLPNVLRKLEVYHCDFFEDQCLPVESLTQLNFMHSNLSVLNQLSLSKVLVNLSIETNESIQSSVVFPSSLKTLSIIAESFYTSLPLGLITLSLTLNSIENEIILPSSLESFTFSGVAINKKNCIFRNGQTIPNGLKSLEYPFLSIVDNNGQSILPKNLEKLALTNSNQPVPLLQLPSNLSYLKLHFNQEININELPSSLHTLCLGGYLYYTHIINPSAIPQGLKLLEICKGSAHLINLTPLTHPNTVIICHSLGLYYEPSSEIYNQIRVLKLPKLFNSPLSTLRLQNKSNLEYLHLGYHFNHPIELSELPIENNIKTLELGSDFKQVINLEHFQNLETLIINSVFDYPTIKTTTLTDSNNNIIYNNYKLKKIIVPNYNYRFLKQLDFNFYQFINLNRSIDQ